MLRECDPLPHLEVEARSRTDLLVGTRETKGILTCDVRRRDGATATHAASALKTTRVTVDDKGILLAGDRRGTMGRMVLSGERCIFST